MENKNSTRTFTYLGVKSGYHAYSTTGLRGTVYVPKGYFDAKSVPSTLELTAPFVTPVVAQTVSDLQAEIAALKAQLASNVAPPAADVTPEEPKAPEAKADKKKSA